MFFDGVLDLDIPTGTTVTNPIGSLGALTVTGSPDSYADCSDDGAHFAIASPSYEVGTGDITIVMKARVTSFVAGEYLVYDYDGSGTAAAAAATGLAVKVTAGGSRRVGLAVPPASETIGSGFLTECSSSTLVAGQDFIIAFRRSSGTWTVWVDADASGGMVSDTPSSNTLGSASLTECEGPVFGAARTASATTSLGGGRIYWYVLFTEALSDADLQLSAWDDEANLKTAWLSSGGTVNTETLESTIAVTDEPLDYVFYNRIAEDTLTIFDELLASVVGTVARVLTDELTVTDGAVFSIIRNMLLQDTIIVSEGGTEQYTTSNIVIDDTLDVVDSALRYAQFTRLGDDALVITDSLISSIVNYVIQNAILSSTISVADEAFWHIHVTRMVESALSLFDENASSAYRFILLSDALSMDDGLVSSYVPDSGSMSNPVIRIGFDQPKIDAGGYALV
jgi:hypothetical protein